MPNPSDPNEIKNGNEPKHQGSAVPAGAESDVNRVVASNAIDGEPVIQPRKRRLKRTPWRVKFLDSLSSQVITVGGIGTILAVLLVVAVLLVNVVPLVSKASIGQPRKVALPSSIENAILFQSDEYESLYWIVRDSGQVDILDSKQGTLLRSERLEPFEGVVASKLDQNSEQSDASDVTNDTLLKIVSASEFQSETDSDDTSVTITGALLGLSNGDLLALEIGIKTDYQNFSSYDASIQSDLQDRSSFVNDGNILQLLPDNLVRVQSIGFIQTSDVIATLDSPPTTIDGRRTSKKRGSKKLLTYDWAAATTTSIHAGQLELSSSRMSRKPKSKSYDTSLELPAITDDQVVGLQLNSQGSALYVADSGRRVTRVLLDESESPRVDQWAETRTNGTNRQTTRLLGNDTILVADNQGSLFGIFTSRGDSGEVAATGEQLHVAHQIDFGQNELQHIAASSMNRIVAAVDRDGAGGVAFVPTDEIMVPLAIDFDEPIQSLSFTPRADALLVLGSNTIVSYPFDPGYPEASFKSLFQPVWYEGYSSPRYIWQSSAATVSAESKLSMMPLVFGTLKATLYTMLISVPLALMAAIYTSEFMRPKWRSRVKPVIELMASIPSVVLGFVAALLFAPLLRENLVESLWAICLLPIFFLAASAIWSLLPNSSMIRYEWLRIPVLTVAFFAAIAVAWLTGSTLESWLFGESLVDWLSNRDENAMIGWFMMLLPVAVLLVVMTNFFVLSDSLRALSVRMLPRNFAMFNIGRYVVMGLAVVLLAFLFATILTTFFGDLRGTFFDQYQERNALLVGVILGFAVIPIIYTISEDALQSVPQHLRSASLGCGATPWQTTVRIVIPTAMSGLFSAVMVGFGRAIGETMVVLMAAGNTPIMDLNPFSGYRTLSATLATELPEAARGSTHFRTLFLAALLLFVFALIANTAAEYVRLRFRKRAYQL